MTSILYVLHSGITGGTFLTNKDLMKNVQYEFDVFLLSAETDVLRLYRYSYDKLSLLKEYSRESSWSAKDFHNNWLSYIYFNILNEYNIDIVHIRHLINHSFDLPKIAKKLNIPVVLSFHDFYFICPFYVLLNEKNEYCAGECNNDSNNCYNPLNSLNNINSKEFIDIWRNNVTEMFKHVDYFITTADFVRNLFLKIYPDMDENHFKVIEHGRDFPILTEVYNAIPSKDKPIKIICPANHLNTMKGSKLIKNIKKEDKLNRLEFHFFGNCHDDVDKCGINHGTFERDEFFKKVKEIHPSFIGIFSIWPETFCHTLTEAWSCGIPVIGSDIGVIHDRILKENGGWLIDISNPKKDYDKIISIANNKEEYVKIQNNIKNIYLKTTSEMAKEYLEVYNNLKPLKWFIIEDYNFLKKHAKNTDDFKSKSFDIEVIFKFDNEYYIDNYLNGNNAVDPISHYLTIGTKKGYNPNEFFDTEWYVNEYFNDLQLNMNPFVHFIKYGYLEGKLPKLFSFDEISKINLNKCLKGREGYYFLVNDSNNELNQHFNENYINSFDGDNFSNSFNLKKKILNENNIRYYYFIVPDKSVVCKKLLPIKYSIVKRNVDNIDVVPDFVDSLNENHYFKFDSHINFKGGEILASKILNYIFRDLTFKKWSNIIKEFGEKRICRRVHDLIADDNWSYSLKEKENILTSDYYSYLKAKYAKSDINKIPNKFLFVNNRKTEFYHNNKCVSNLRVLIFHDSTIEFLKEYFSLYFNETLFYWDHGMFNKEIIEWYKPDMILEIRVERFLENIYYPTWLSNEKLCISKY